MPIRGDFGAGSMVASLPASARPGAGFVVCPLLWQDPSQGGWAIDMLYQLAYERAQADLRTGWYERLYNGLLN
jgi:hypothetical protein